MSCCISLRITLLAHTYFPILWNSVLSYFSIIVDYGCVPDILREIAYATTLITRVMGPTWGPTGGRQDPGEPHVSPWTVLTGELLGALGLCVLDGQNMKWLGECNDTDIIFTIYISPLKMMIILVLSAIMIHDSMIVIHMIFYSIPLSIYGH